MMQRIYPGLLFLLLFNLLLTSKAFSQGVGNHLTISMENCAQTSSTITFDIFIVSDGAAGSDLRLNSAQFGINYDSCFIPSGGTLNLSYIVSSSDFIPVLNTFSFPVSTSNEMRIVESPYTGGNTGHTMIIGHKYRVGTFRLVSSLNFSTCYPHFSFQDVAAANRTTTAAIVYFGNAVSTNSMVVYGTGDGQIITSVLCICTNGINENEDELSIKFYPNPVHDKLTLLFQKNNTSIRIFNTEGELKYSSLLNNRQAIIDISELAKGVYILELTNGISIRREKFIKTY